MNERSWKLGEDGGREEDDYFERLEEERTGYGPDAPQEPEPDPFLTLLTDTFEDPYMIKLTLNDEHEATTITNGLRVAAETFDSNAKICDEDGQPRIAEQFRRQAKESREMADRVENL